MTGTAAAEPLASPRSAWAPLQAPIFRATVSDLAIEAAARRYHRGDGLPAVAHLVHADTSQ